MNTKKTRSVRAKLKNGAGKGKKAESSPSFSAEVKADPEKARKDAAAGREPVKPTEAYLLEQLTCPICFDVYHEPISLLCGHNFCRCCLQDALQRVDKQCPLCRKPCLLNPSAVEPNMALSTIIKDVFPVAWAEKAEAAERSRSEDQPLPVFLYPEPSFPGNKHGWRFFEPRYKLLCRKISDSGVMKFGYTYKEQPSVNDLILVLDVTKMEERPGDGTFIVEAQASHTHSRCRVKDIFVETGSQGLTMARCEEIVDLQHSEAERDALAAECKVLLESAKTRLGSRYSDDTVQPPSLSSSNRAAEQLSTYMVGLMGQYRRYFPTLDASEWEALLLGTDTIHRLQEVKRHYESMEEPAVRNGGAFGHRGLAALLGSYFAAMPRAGAGAPGLGDLGDNEELSQAQLDAYHEAAQEMAAEMENQDEDEWGDEDEDEDEDEEEDEDVPDLLPFEALRGIVHPFLLPPSGFGRAEDEDEDEDEDENYDVD